MITPTLSVRDTVGPVAKQVGRRPEVRDRIAKTFRFMGRIRKERHFR